MDRTLPLAALIGLGITQITGYGTLYYSFSVLVPDMAADLGVSERWVYGAFSMALIISGLTAPWSGRLADRHGAGRVMGYGSVAAVLTLVMTALAPTASIFGAALIAMQLFSSTVFYPTAFTAIVQAGGSKARTSIVHLTLIAGFSSSIFWPLTSWLHSVMSWRDVYVVYAAFNAALCVPIHFMIARLTGAAVSARAEAASEAAPEGPAPNRLVFALMLAGFAIEGYALSAMLVHMVPLTAALGLGSMGLLVASLFGPSQVASRLINLGFGQNLRQAWLAVIASVLMPIGLIILLSTNPWMPGAFAFAILMGLGSGLTSIVGGTLPLELFGRNGYGRLMGWTTTAKQIVAAVAPFTMSASISILGVVPSLWTIIATGLIGAVAFALIPFVAGPRREA